MGSRRTVLVVEDGEIDSESLTPEHAALAVVVASSDDAECYVFNEDTPGPDLVMLGAERVGLLIKLRADDRTRSIPVVVLTDTISEGEIDSLYRYGANSCLARPANGEEMTDLVATAIHYWLDLNLKPGAK